MSNEALLMIAALIGGLMLLGGLVYLWMNRTPRFRRSTEGRLPLFGGDYDVDVDGNALDEDAAPVPFRPAAPISAAPVSATPISAASSPAPAGVSPFAPQPQAPIAPPVATPQPPGGAGAAAAYRQALANGAARQAAPASNGPGANGAAANRGMNGMANGASASAPMPPARPATPSSWPVQPGPTPPRSNPAITSFSTGFSTPSSSIGTTPRGPVPAHIPGELRSSPVSSSQGIPGTMVEGHLLRFSVPQEGTLQFLPGRLEIAAGRDAGREIRFVNVPGPSGTEVTFGRSDGELYRHIQLRDQTVSRSHARMRLVDGIWYLLNLSQTNPVVHNGQALTGGEERPVRDGDRIEMGEVLFTFRSR